MGIYDRDWYRDHNKKPVYARPTSVIDHRYSALAKVLIWLGILSLTLAFFFWREAPVVFVKGGVAEVTIPQAPDGHYYVDGQINGAKVRFLIDTGATYIAVSAAIASRLGISPDSSATFNTANGRVRGQTASKQSVTVAGLSAPPLTVSVMPSLTSDALLGQNFLKHVTMTQADQFLVLRGSAHSAVTGHIDSRIKWSIILGIGLMLLAMVIRRLGRVYLAVK